MEAVQVLTFTLAAIVFLAMYRRSTQRGRQPTIKVSDPAVARQTLIEKADAFSNRPSTLFPVPLITARRRRRQSHGITTVPFGPHWRALRANITATILQPWRQGLLSPFHKDAVDALVAGLLARGAGDVVIRDSLYSAVFGMLTRLCFGEGVDAHHVRSMERMMQEFRVAIGESRVFARSTMAKLKHWKQWRSFLAIRSKQAALFHPLIIDARRRQRAGQRDNTGIRPYIDTLIDLRIPDENDSRAKRALTDGEMVSLVVEFLAIVESIVAILEWALAHLVNQQEVQRKLRHEIADDHGNGPSESGYLHAVVQETLRLHPPFPLTMREVRSEGAVIGTATVPAAGMRVQFVLGDIAKKLWKDPNEFRPERFLPGGQGESVGLVPAGQNEIMMMPFGAGQRACPGAALGMQYTKGFLAALVRGFEWAPPEKGSGDGGVDMTELYGFIAVMKSPLKTHMTPRA